MDLITRTNTPINKILIFKGGGLARTGSGFSRTMTHGALAAERMMSRFESSIASVQPKFTRTSTLGNPKPVVTRNILLTKVSIPEQPGFISTSSGVVPRYVSVDTNIPHRYHSTDTGAMTHKYTSIDTYSPLKYISTDTGAQFKDVIIEPPVQVVKHRGFGRLVLLPAGLAFGTIGLGGLLTSDSRLDDIVASNPSKQPMIIYRPSLATPVNNPQEIPAETNNPPIPKKSSNKKKDISRAERIIYVPVLLQPVQNDTITTNSPLIVSSYPEGVDYEPLINLSDMLIGLPVMPGKIQPVSVNF